MDTPLNLFSEVISAASENVHFEDFKTGGRLTGNFRKGYEARMAAFFQLENQGFVKLVNSRLSLGHMTDAPWLVHGLNNGDPEAWKICDEFPEKLKKFDPENTSRAEIGLAGELYIIEWLKDKLDPEKATEIDHISIRDDSAGYDIVAPTLNPSEKVMLEIKTTTRSADTFRFFLSRNEWEVSQQLPNWFLVFVQKKSGVYTLYGYLDGKSLGSYLPIDNHPHFGWKVSSGQFSQDDLFQGMPGFD